MKTFTWTLAVTVDEIWVADGLDLTPERLQQLLLRALPYIRSDELTVEGVSAPARAEILEAQGYDPQLGEPDPKTGLQHRA